MALPPQFLKKKGAAPSGGGKGPVCATCGGPHATKDHPAGGKGMPMGMGQDKKKGKRR